MAQFILILGAGYSVAVFIPAVPEVDLAFLIHNLYDFRTQKAILQREIENCRELK